MSLFLPTTASSKEGDIPASLATMYYLPSKQKRISFSVPQ